MLNNILGSKELFTERLSDGAMMFPIGLGVVFLGIIVIILAITIAGKIMSATSNQGEKKVKEVKVEEPAPIMEAKEENEIPAEVKAAIVAVISAYYFSQGSQQSNCEFVVKKIKRI